MMQLRGWMVADDSNDDDEVVVVVVGYRWMVGQGQHCHDMQASARSDEPEWKRTENCFRFVWMDLMM